MGTFGFGGQRSIKPRIYQRIQRRFTPWHLGVKGARCLWPTAPISCKLGIWGPAKSYSAEVCRTPPSGSSWRPMIWDCWLDIQRPLENRPERPGGGRSRRRIVSERPFARRRPPSLQFPRGSTAEKSIDRSFSPGSVAGSSGTKRGYPHIGPRIVPIGVADGYHFPLPHGVDVHFA